MLMNRKENVLDNDILATVQSVDDITNIDIQLEGYGILVKDILDLIDKKSNNMDSLFSVCYKYMLPFMSPSSAMQNHGLDLKIHAFIMALYNIRYLKAGKSVIRASHFLSESYIELPSNHFKDKFNVRENINSFTVYMSNIFQFDVGEGVRIKRNLKKATDETNALYNLAELKSATGSFLCIQDFLPILACSSQPKLFEPPIKKPNFPVDGLFGRIENKQFNRSLRGAIKDHAEAFNQILAKCNKYYGKNDLISRLLCYYKLEYVMKCDFMNHALRYMRTCDREKVYEEIRIACRLRNVLSRGTLLSELSKNFYFNNVKSNTENENNYSKAKISELNYLADFFMPAFENVFLSVLIHKYDTNIDTIDKILTEYISQHLKNANSPFPASRNIKQMQSYSKDSILHQAWMLPLERILSPEEWNYKSNTKKGHRPLERIIDLDKSLQDGMTAGDIADTSDLKSPKPHKNEQLRKLIKLLPDTDCLATGSLSYNNAALQLTDEIICHMLGTSVNLRVLFANNETLFSFDEEEYNTRNLNPFGILNKQEFKSLCCAYKLFYSSASENSCANLFFRNSFPKMWEHIKPCILYLIKTASMDDPFPSEIATHQTAMEKYLKPKLIFPPDSQTPLPDYINPNNRERLLRLCQMCAIL